MSGTANTAGATTEDGWPALRVDAWEDTRTTLHMWLQVVGKIRMVHAPLVNHWWQVPLYVTPRGLGTSSIPYRNGMFDLEFDVVAHRLLIRSSSGEDRAVPLEPQSVARFHDRTMVALAELGIEAPIRPVPTEVEPAAPFAEDHANASYDAGAVAAYWRQLIQAERVITRFRSEFLGKVSPVHFFWGAMDLACTRFSGRPAPTHPGGAPNCADWVMEEGYSHELSSCGFWAGGGEEGAFYSYAYPEPDGYRETVIGVDGAFYSDDFRQFLLPYEAVRTAADPDAVLLEFLRATYRAAAVAGGWDEGLVIDPHRLDRHGR
ncbi:hypothetical protein FJV46_07710 [Arthrobacter agilis]|uniref:DUF5996 family protein n=1 Tax=Arthrobacter agilis TaxID=37921 RepID=UPI000B354020|nr:DUF5996 family protein [Arthrobacter agilis]OUM43033.1 hypothetical protein B8W74_07240 [Arthrobacter agilis]PPB45977.1 hypothetical protein CI784_09435 [Arthrobacter agilis]TPV25515.1 hypothetical protein FJV46_07710 [Arthrobacter agilis]VDR33271.1 Uncharacterised protein [Arthrobacter agilis]